MLILLIFQTKFVLCIATIIYQEWYHVFQGIFVLVVPVVHYHLSYLEITDNDLKNKVNNISISDRICPLQYHYHIRCGIKCFLRDISTSSSSSSLPNVIFENNVSDLKYQVNADTSETELCLSLQQREVENKVRPLEWSTT